MDHQSLPNVTAGTLSPALHPTQGVKHELSSVVDLRPVNTGMRSMSNEMQPVEEDLQHVAQDIHQVSRQIHQVNSGIPVEELRLTEGNMQSVSDEQVDPLGVASEDTLTMDGEMGDMEQNQDVQVIAHQVRFDCNSLYACFIFLCLVCWNEIGFHILLFTPQ